MKRNLPVDLTKLVFSTLVVAIHLPLYKGFSEVSSEYTLGWLLSNGIARVAVPCFFIINGYFLNIQDDAKFYKTIKHLGILYGVWMLLYLFAYYSGVRHNLPYLIKTLVFGYHHLWYVIALVMSAFLLRIVVKYKQGIALFTLLSFSILLFLTGYIIQITHHQIFLYRNFVFFAFPFLSIGYLLRKTNNAYILSDSILRVILLVSWCSLLLESYFSMKYHIGTDFYISLFLFCPTLMIFLFRSKKSTTSGVLSDVSGAVYFTHISVILFFKDFFFDNSRSNVEIYPFVILGTLIVSYLAYLVNKKIPFLL